ncbi:MAG: hypothetical protein AAF514_03890, partial [Verrucomicrobiota bacterium]
MKLLLRLFLVSVLAFGPSLASAGDQDNTKVEGSLKDIRWGTHWAGPELKASDLAGKVVLLKI